MRHLLTILLLACLAALQYRYWVGVHGQQEIRGLEREIHRLEAANLALEARNQELAAEVDALAQGTDAVEARARRELGMIKPGETFFRVIENR